MPSRTAQTKRRTRPGTGRLAARYIRIRRNTGDSQDAGFTLIEIMVAAMILLILISVAGFVVTRHIGKAKVISAKNQIQIFSMALNSYFLDSGQYPSTEQGLAALWEKPVLEPVPEGWEGPYLDKFVPEDPWDHPYEYTSPGPYGLPFGIRSFGADGLEGGEGAERDIASWEK
jgi:general secretion pathway protein G